jgi:hypothetical protein
MAVRKPCPEAPGPLEAYARQFDACFGSLAQRRAFRAYLQGLLLPRDRNKTLTALAGTEPAVGALPAARRQGPGPSTEGRCRLPGRSGAKPESWPPRRRHAPGGSGCLRPL